METQCRYLKLTQRTQLLKWLPKFEDLFYGIIGNRKTDPVDFELKEDAKPIFPRPYPVPKLHEIMFKK